MCPCLDRWIDGWMDTIKVTGRAKTLAVDATPPQHILADGWRSSLRGQLRGDGHTSWPKNTPRRT